MSSARVSAGPNMSWSFIGTGRSIIGMGGSAAQAPADSAGTRTRSPEVARPCSGHDGCDAAIAVATAPPIEWAMRTTPDAAPPCCSQISPIAVLSTSALARMIESSLSSGLDPT